MIHVYTSIAENYLPKATVLAKSIRKYHPDWIIHLLLVQEQVENTSLIEQNFDNYHLIDSLEIPAFKPWAFCHTVVELSTAVKPFLLRKLLQRDDCTAVVYIDPDIVLFSPLTEIEDALSKHAVVLTPHQTLPEEDIQGVMDNEICSLQHGTYNLGFVAVANNSVGKSFANWWSDRTYQFCRDEIPNGLFTDQKWIDLVPALFDEVKIERSPRFNIATWNIRTRKLEGSIQALKVNGLSVGFYHFTGFDSGAHELMANIYGKDQPLLMQLIHWYKQETAEVLNIMKPFSAVWPYANFDDQSPISNEMRYIYRERRDLRAMYANPFDTSSPANFKDWWFHIAKFQYPSLFVNSTKKAELGRLKNRLSIGFFEEQPTNATVIRKGVFTFIRELKFKLNLFIWIPKRLLVLGMKEGLLGIYTRILR
jgi:hypothetical protein